MVRFQRFASVLIVFALGAVGCAHAPAAPSVSRSTPPVAAAEATVTTTEPTSASLTAAAGALARVGLTVRELASGVYLAVQASPRFSAANILVVRMRDGSVVFCSSPYDTQATRALVRYVRARFAPRRMIAINTHFHGDGTAGNEGYAAEGVETYASEHTARLQAQRGVAGLEGMARYVETDAPALAARIRATHAAPAQHQFRESAGLSLSFGGEPVRVLFVGAAHTADNVVVYFPTRGVLFGGCMVRAYPGLGNTADADLAHWAGAAEAALALGPRLVIPGHGEPGGPELLRTTAAAARKH